MLDLLPYLILALIAMLASFATFFSGFGLGTLLLPVFALFFEIEIAILATALVHFTTGIFKFLLTMKSIDFSISSSVSLPLFPSNKRTEAPEFLAIPPPSYL